ncbi:unnamed protein product [Lepeophtheirus salmonis]|uniref:(salmon louse) hypothetical protein n=1 Tax=Lepeophtheirus salmonis TaxID=72036 RepID=A0A7R8H3K8_LEPSM|nr:unnamed protein product [Lepeophtheirus salmonis]CAF2833614.1 unnamed protein product [Lepeophtheirus salmonis]
MQLRNDMDSYYTSDEVIYDPNGGDMEGNEDDEPIPEFDTNVPKNITAVIGKTAKLYCKVNNLGNKSISWLRHDNLHILTVGRYTYTSDSRFEPINPEGTNEWILRIRHAANEDSGVYECQISSQPVKSLFVNLRIVTPIASILGKNEMFVDVGSTINITCTVHHSPEPPTSIKWLHDSEPIDYTSMRGGVSVLTNKAETTVSSLIIQLATPKDGGQYSCQAGEDLKPAVVKVHVLNG